MLCTAQPSEIREKRSDPSQVSHTHLLLPLLAQVLSVRGLLRYVTTSSVVRLLRWRYLPTVAVMILSLATVLLVGLLTLGAEAAIIPATGHVNGASTAFRKREIPPTHVVHERGLAGRTWEKKGRVPPGALLPMRIGLRQSNLDVGHDMLIERCEHPQAILADRHLHEHFG